MDRYFDYPDHRLTEQGCELRVRTIKEYHGQTWVLLAYQEPVPDAGNGAKREHETTAEDAEMVVSVLTALDRDLLVPVVTVPELAGQTFLELETRPTLRRETRPGTWCAACAGRQ